MNSFIWGNPMPEWFTSLNTSYRMNPDIQQIELPTPNGNVIVNPGDCISMDEHGNFLVEPPKQAHMNRAQRRQSHKTDERLVVTNITITFENGQSVELDTNKVMIIDKETKAELFKQVMEKKA